MITEGRKVVAYDPRIWHERGYDLGHNEDCWKPATVLKVYVSRGDLLVDLLFDHNPRISHGHFADGPCSGIRD